MDSFVIIKPQKKKGDISLHDKEIKLLKKCLDENKNVFLCGSAGYGKTFILKSVLNESNSIEIWDEPLRKKDIFLPTLTKSNMHVYIEDYETDMLIQKHLIEKYLGTVVPKNDNFFVVEMFVFFTKCNHISRHF